MFVCYINELLLLLLFNDFKCTYEKFVNLYNVHDIVFIPNHTFLVCFGGISGEFGRAMVCIFGETQSSQNTHSKTKRACNAAEVYQKGTIRYLPYPNSSKNPVNLW